MNRVAYRAIAEADLVNIWLFIAQDSPTSADTYLERLKQVFALLSENPMMGAERSEIANGARSFPVDRYVIYYQLSDTGITILRI